MSTAPSLRMERSLLRSGARYLAAVDEVGRGALSGPVTIGMVVITETTKTAPQGVRDSKLLTPEARQRLVPRIQRWATCWAVGHASPAEIDELGMTAALRLAGHRALAQLTVEPDALLLDGNHDYLSVPEQGALFGTPALLARVPPVVTRIKADMTCAAVAAASVLAKTARDAIMLALHEEAPAYCWAENKGYSAPAHIEALAALGPSVHHRRSWRLPGVDAPVGTAPEPPADLAAGPPTGAVDEPADGLVTPTARLV